MFVLVPHTRKLEILDSLRNFIRVVVLESFRTTMRGMRVLVLKACEPDLDDVIVLLRRFPYVVLKRYEGKQLDVDFAKFFVVNAKVLESIKLGSTTVAPING
ncbi:hypothetical protein D1007_44944 [Hordeum vulgare]|nr:hypothetical protein D1007_44944 [Hordeum vulgare]